MTEAIRLLLTTISAILTARGEDRLADYIDLAETLIREGSDAADELRELTLQIQTMVAEDRGPTDDELADVRTRRDALVAQLDAARGDPG
jgi:hypothetical protein